MLTISRDHVIDSMDSHNSPAAFCDSGETVRFETRDCYDDSILPDGSVRDGKRLANPATGPLYIRGAEPGDVLKVEIVRVVSLSPGLMRTSTTGGAFHDLINEKRITRFFPLLDDRIRFTDCLELRTDTMIGVIGTAPAFVPVDTETPADHGGNMDCRRIREGSTLFLPVGVPGALLALGNLHAKMGDGESLICGMECRGIVDCKVSVLKDTVLPLPALLDRRSFMTIQSAPTLDEAAQKAARAMFRFLDAQTSLSKADIGMLLSLEGNLVICQIVDPQKTVRMEISSDILGSLGIVLG